MATISTFKESLDLLFIYGEEMYKRDFNQELKLIFAKSINKAYYTVKQWGSHHSREEILEELKRRYN
jgi:hypothetical protein